MLEETNVNLRRKNLHCEIDHTSIFFFSTVKGSDTQPCKSPREAEYPTDLYPSHQY